MKKIIVVIYLSLIAALCYSQKVFLTHDVYDSWNSLKDFKISKDGKYSAFGQNPQAGDGVLHIINNSTGEILKTFSRGNSHEFASNSDFLIFKVSPQYDTIRNLKIKRKKEDSFPKDSLFIYSILKDSVWQFERVKSFKFATEENSVLAFLFEKEEVKKDKEEKQDSIVQDTVPISDTIKKPKKPEGSKLVYWDLQNNKKSEFENVTDYFLSENGKLLIFKSEFKDSIDSVEVCIVDNVLMQKRHVIFTNGYVEGLSVDKMGERFAFYYSSDTAKNKKYKIITGESFKYSKFEIAEDEINKMPEGWAISKHSSIKFSENGKLMYFGTTPVYYERKTDSLPEDEIVNLDIWSWTDGEIQSAQLKKLDKDKKKSYTAVYNFDKDIAMQIADSSMDEVRISKKGNCETALAFSNYKYEHLIQWKSADIKDYWFVNLVSGERKKFASAFDGTVSLSPGGKFAVIYDKQDSTWYMHDLRRNISYPLTDLTGVGFYNDEYDHPGLPSNYGIAGWLKNDRAVILYDKYDLWLCNAGKAGEIVNITNSFGRDNNIVLRFIKTDNDSEYIDEQELILLQGFNKKSKESAVYSLDLNSGTTNLIYSANMSIGNITKAKDTEVYSFSKSDYNTFPDRYIVKDLSDWNNSIQITDINPQKSDYLWGSVELYNWIDFNGDTVCGLLYKPENFDPNIKYPMIVYFYEKYSDHLHAHYVPAPSRSVINFPLFTSNGYIVFIPDIKYKTGTPGKDAYNSIVSGTYSLIEKGFVNKDKIGIQGQSWGGYQVAYLVTQTDLYACAMAGAAVSNMTSAYGGLRMEGGNSRMMQYEEGQSRIGANMWENLPAYIENSPVFYADKINTPLLMMHNDGDGAVPWSQGVELFLAMKRLNKPVWLLNYNGEEHNLKNRANCKDLSIRMSEFFDYYLKDTPCPQWLEQGVPAVWKGSR